jgi:hypothetical protein
VSLSQEGLPHEVSELHLLSEVRVTLVSLKYIILKYFGITSYDKFAAFIKVISV